MREFMASNILGLILGTGIECVILYLVVFNLLLLDTGIECVVCLLVYIFPYLISIHFFARPRSEPKKGDTGDPALSFQSVFPRDPHPLRCGKFICILKYNKNNKKYAI